jgi:Amt family ammonium transporter
VFAVVAAPIGHPITELFIKPYLVKWRLLTLGQLYGFRWLITIALLFCVFLAWGFVDRRMPQKLITLWKGLWINWYRRFWLCILIAPLFFVLATWTGYNFSVSNSRKVQPGDPVLFTTDDVLEVDTFVHELEKPTAMSKYVKAHLSTEVTDMLATNTETNTEQVAALKRVLVRDLNTIITNRFYSVHMFSHFTQLPLKAAALLKGQNLGDGKDTTPSQVNSIISREMIWAQHILIEDQFARAGAMRPHFPINELYRLISTILVYLMQFGFIAFEAGEVRKNYRLESAAKNLLVFITAFGTYVGMSLLRGNWFEDLTHNSLMAHQTTLELVYHAGFASTICLIIANTITERTSVFANLLLAAASAGFAYPLLSGICWEDGWLSRFGFTDTAGACVVHLLGGTIGFFSAIMAGSSFRTKAWYLLDKPKERDQRSLIPLTVIGGLFLWFGWLGFNSGNANSHREFLTAFRNTSLAVCGGAAASILLFFLSYTALSVYYSRPNHETKTFWQRVRGRIVDEFILFYAAIAEWERVIIGVMGGLVCVTANASKITPKQAVAESFIGGMVVVLGSSFIAVKMRRRLDDPTGAFATHALAGLTGVCLLTTYYVDGNSFGIQLFGCCVCICLGWAVALVIRLIIWMSVSATEIFAIDKWEWWWAGMFLQLYRMRLSFVDQVTGKHGIELLGPGPHARGDEAPFMPLWEKERWNEDDNAVQDLRATRRSRACIAAADRTAARLGEYLVMEEPESSGAIYDLVTNVLHRTGAFENIDQIELKRDWVELRRSRFALIALALLNEHNEFIDNCSEFSVTDILCYQQYIALLESGRKPENAGTVWELLYSHWINEANQVIPGAKEIGKLEIQRAVVDSLNKCKNGVKKMDFMERLFARERFQGWPDACGSRPAPGKNPWFRLKGSNITWGSRALLGYSYPEIFAKNILDRCNDLALCFTMSSQSDLQSAVATKIDRRGEIERQKCVEALILTISYLAEDLARSRELVYDDDDYLVFPKGLFHRSFKSLEILSQGKKRANSKRSYFPPWETRRLARIGKINLASSLLASKFGPP